MKVLVIGGGGREHAVCAALKKSPRVTELHCAPGNGGISEIAVCHESVKTTDIDGILKLAKTLRPDYVFVASDDPLVLGAVDRLNAAGIKTFGPRANAAAIEGSKVFSKSFMRRHRIPTAKYDAFDDADAATLYIKQQNTFPTVIKCDGLALGKGAVICEDLASAEKTVNEIMTGGKFGASGRNIIVEEYMSGVEVTVLAFTDGGHVVCMPAATDHKRAFDGDKGLNTGGMGVIAPTPYYTEAHRTFAEANIILPTIAGLKADGRPFSGCLYFELMVTANPSETRVIEYNCRFGDPEAQAVLPLLETDLAEIVTAVWERRLSDIDVRFSGQSSATIVIASGGYPEKYGTGFVISGIDSAKASGCEVYHAGTKRSGEDFVTAGGRVLCVTATAETLPAALDKAYSGAEKISFEHSFYRKDIGKKALETRIDQY